MEKSIKEVPATFNARAESVADKPMFRGAFKERRCIVPASGFFEWTGEKGAKQPHLFTAADGSPLLAFAGLGPLERSPHRRMGAVLHDHRVGRQRLDGARHDRMPVLLEAKDFDAWLDSSLGTEVLKPAPAETLREWKVSPRLNRTGVGDDDPTIIEPLNET